MSVIPLLLLLQQGVPARAPDARGLREAARHAELEYENAVRSHAPIATDYSPSEPCYEHVGRYCLFEGADDDRPLPPDHPAVQAARRVAVETLRRAFSADPSDAEVASSVVRYLVEDGRAAEAVSAARAFRWARGAGTEPPARAAAGPSRPLHIASDTAFALADWLLGFALHAAGRDSAALAAFGEALARSPPEERARAVDVSYLLDPGERRRYHALSDEERRAYEERLWAIADPLLLVPANAALAEHLARHVLVRLLPDAPAVRGEDAWGKDLEELTRRFGVPAARKRIPGGGLANPSFVELYEPTQVALVASRLSERVALRPPRPGDPDRLDDPRARSTFPPATLKELHTLHHQITRFPEPRGTVIRADGVLPVDSAHGSTDTVRVGLFLLEPDSLRVLDRVEDRVTLWHDTAHFTLFSALPPGRFIYALEALDAPAKVGARARYRIDVAPTASPGPGSAGTAAVRLSDVLVCEPFAPGPLPDRRDDPGLRARADLELQPHDTVGLYAEIRRPERASGTYYSASVSLQRMQGPSPLARAAAWIGGIFGLGGSPPAPRLQWEVDSGVEPLTPLAVNLDLGGLESGLWAIRLSVLDRRSGEEVRAERTIRVSGY